mgnify:CR=1 FL=1
MLLSLSKKKSSHQALVSNTLDNDVMSGVQRDLKPSKSCPHRKPPNNFESVKVCANIVAAVRFFFCLRSSGCVRPPLDCLIGSALWVDADFSNARLIFPYMRMML